LPKSKKKWPVIAGVVILGGLVLLMWYFSRPVRTAMFRCEVCKTFGGQTVCRTAAAATRMDAERTASDGACSDLTSGMNNLEQCRNSDSKVTWK
jgi:hypothetical protein